MFGSIFDSISQSQSWRYCNTKLLKIYKKIWSQSLSWDILPFRSNINLDLLITFDPPCDPSLEWISLDKSSLDLNLANTLGKKLRDKASLERLEMPDPTCDPSLKWIGIDETGLYINLAYSWWKSLEKIHVLLG